MSPLRRCRTPQIGLQTLTQTDLPLEFVGRPVFFSPGDWQRSHFLLSIRGAAGSLPPRIPRAFLSSTNTARAEGGGIQGGPPPCAGGPGTRRSLAYLCLLSLREKVGRGAGRSARSWGPWGRSPSHRHAGVRGAAPRQRKNKFPPLTGGKNLLYLNRK